MVAEPPPATSGEAQDAAAAAAPAPESAAAAQSGAAEEAQALPQVAPQAPAPAPQAAAAPTEEEQVFAQLHAAAAREQYPDAFSVYVGNLDGQEEIWPEQLYEHFKLCGEVKRITIKIDKVTGERMGFAYVDFADAMSAETALSLDGSDFCGRHIKVNKKRTYSHNSADWKGRGKGALGKSASPKGSFGKGWGWSGGAGAYTPWWHGGGSSGKSCWGRSKGWSPY